MTRYLSYETFDPQFKPICCLCDQRCESFRRLYYQLPERKSYAIICSACVVTIATGVKGTNANEHLSIAPRNRGSNDRQPSHRLRRGRDQ